MSKIERLAAAFAGHVAIGWPASSSGAQRVIMVVYDPADERALRRRFELFAQGTQAASKSWYVLDLTPVIGEWLGGHRYREVYFEEPEELLAAGEDRIASAIAEKVAAALRSHAGDPQAVLALCGLASLFGFVSVANVLSRVEHAIEGRLLVFFPGRVQDGRYRLLDARESWDYHAIPITLDDTGDVR